jgi:mono/diheme cytochrome c family protein
MRADGVVCHGSGGLHAGGGPGKALTFTTPLHIGYRVSHGAQVTAYDTAFIRPILKVPDIHAIKSRYLARAKPLSCS